MGEMHGGVRPIPSDTLSKSIVHPYMRRKINPAYTKRAKPIRHDITSTELESAVTPEFEVEFEPEITHNNNLSDYEIVLPDLSDEDSHEEDVVENEMFHRTAVESIDPPFIPAPPLPCVPVPKIEHKKLSYSSPDSDRGNLLESIRNMGGVAKLKSASENQSSKDTPKIDKKEDFMLSLTSRLTIRRSAIDPKVSFECFVRS